jgi:hypothetical protein
MSEWRHTKRDAPETGMQVLCWFQDDDYGCCQIASREKGDRGRFFWMNTEGDALDEPTHWMPLPPAPTNWP